MTDYTGMWIVIGGHGKGGIIVREGEELSSEQFAEKLEYGAVIQETTHSGSRMEYRLMHGQGPTKGWISTKIHGKDLVVQVLPPHVREFEERPGEEPALTFYAISDVHVELKDNMEWLRSLPRFEKAAIIVAGDLGVSLGQVKQALQLFKQRFQYVFYCYGNHETWCHKSIGDEELHFSATDSFEKLDALRRLCMELEVYTTATLVEDIWVVPVLGWYHKSWDTDPPLARPPKQDLTHEPPEGDRFATDTGACKWQGMVNASLELAMTLDKQNENWGIWPLPPELVENLQKPRGERKQRVISFSHFLPRLELMPEKRFLFTPNLTQIVGSEFIKNRVDMLQPDLHVFGHSHFPWDATLADGVRYKSWPLGTPAEQARRIASYPTEDTELWHPLPVFDSLGRHYPTGPCCWYSLMYTRIKREPKSYEMANFVADIFCPKAPVVPSTIISPGYALPLTDEEQKRRRDRYEGKSTASMRREIKNWSQV